MLYEVITFCQAKVGFIFHGFNPYAAFRILKPLMDKQSGMQRNNFV